MIGYLSITGTQLALLLNFKRARLEWKRVVKEQDDVAAEAYPRTSAPSAVNIR